MTENCFCTYFNSGYLDRALVLYRSLAAVCGEFQLFILPLDEKCADILQKMQLPGVTVLPVSEIETEEMKRQKAVRNMGEYCWMFTPQIIRYVLDHFSVKSCTYIDADMKFFADPKVLLDEMNPQETVGVVEHRFYPAAYYKNQAKSMGRFCVEFNTFTDSENARAVLREWSEQCMESTTQTSGGDQRYVEAWPKKYAGVHILKNHGGGVAPWNLGRYRLADADAEKAGIWLYNKETRQTFQLVFYHYQQLRRLDDGRFKLNICNLPGKMDDTLVRAIYQPYLWELEQEAQMLCEQYGLEMPRTAPAEAQPPVHHTFGQKLANFLKLDFWQKVERLYVKQAARKDQSRDIVRAEQWKEASR